MPRVLTKTEVNGTNTCNGIFPIDGPVYNSLKSWAANKYEKTKTLPIPSKVRKGTGCKPPADYKEFDEESFKLAWNKIRGELGIGISNAFKKRKSEVTGVENIPVGGFGAFNFKLYFTISMITFYMFYIVNVHKFQSRTW